MADEKTTSGNDMLKRVLTAAVLIAVVVGLLLLRQLLPDREVGKKVFDILFYLMSLLGTFEMLKAFKEKTTFFEKTVVAVFAVAFIPVVVFLGMRAGIIVLLTAVGLIFCDYVLSYRKLTNEGVGASLVSLFYPTVFLSAMYYLNHKFGLTMILLLFTVSALSDTFALFVGMIFKGKKLCPEISPKKTVSGAIGGLLGGLLGGLIIWFIVFLNGKVFVSKFADVLIFLFAGILGSVATQFGDLVESVMKRKIGLKDFGNIFPGHGGVLDRIDGYIFNAFFLFVYFSFITILIR